MGINQLEWSMSVTEFIKDAGAKLIEQDRRIKELEDRFALQEVSE